MLIAIFLPNKIIIIITFLEHYFLKFNIANFKTNFLPKFFQFKKKNRKKSIWKEFKIKTGEA